MSGVVRCRHGPDGWLARTSARQSYTNAAGTAGRTFQGLQRWARRQTPTLGASCIRATRPDDMGHSSASRPAIPASRAIESFTWSGGTAYTGSASLRYASRARCSTSPFGHWHVVGRDLDESTAVAPAVRDGACLVWMLFGTGATDGEPITSAIDFGWGG